MHERTKLLTEAEVRFALENLIYRLPLYEILRILGEHCPQVANKLANETLYVVHKVQS